MDKSLFAVIVLSNWRKEPLAALRGFAKTFSPLAIASSFNFSKDDFGI